MMPLPYHQIARSHNLCLASYSRNSQPGFFEIDDLRAGVLSDGDYLDIVVRGTANLANAGRDMRVMPWRTQSGFWGHKGIVAAVKKLYPELLRRINQYPADMPRRCHGHSFGGGTALELAAVVGGEAITFNAMRTYLRWFGAPDVVHTRIVRDDDPVQYAPCMLYTHYCPAFVINDGDHELLDISDHALAGCLPKREVWEAA